MTENGNNTELINIGEFKRLNVTTKFWQNSCTYTACTSEACQALHNTTHSATVHCLSVCLSIIRRTSTTLCLKKVPTFWLYV